MTDHTPQLRQLMQPVGLTSFKALAQQACLSEKQLRRLRRGEIAQLPVGALFRLSQTLQVPVLELIETFAADRPNPQPQQSPHPAAAQEFAALRQEYDRLQAQLTQQQQQLWQEFQQASLQTLESLLLQLPTAAFAAEQNPQAPAVKLLPLLRPIDRLLQDWGIEPIAQVGDEIPYNPQQHQLMSGTATAGDRVRVRYIGYRQGEKLLYRAKVSPVEE
jgi:molecular chaperone GrpE (heat shock protein)